MYEIIRYSSTDLEDVFEKIQSLQDKLEYYEKKSNKRLTIETRFSYNLVDDYWEGELEVINAKENK